MNSYEYLITYMAILLMCIFLTANMGFKMNRGVGNLQDIIDFRCLTVSVIVGLISEVLWRIIMLLGVQNSIPYWISNLVDLIATGFVTYFLYTFVIEHLRSNGFLSGKKRRFGLKDICIMVLLLCQIASLKTKWIFYIDENLNYVRGKWYIIQVIFTMGFLLIAIGQILNIYRKSNVIEKQTLKPLLWFTTFPIIGGILQVCIGVAPLSSIMITLGIVYFFVSMQDQSVTTDALTGLTNRNRMDHVLQHKLYDAEEKPFIIIMADLDNFKEINDTYGHLEGDLVLKRVADVFRKLGHWYSDLFICRFGGDEFVLTLNASNEIELINFENELRKELDLLKEIYDTPYNTSMQMGHFLVNKKYEKIDEILDYADKMLYDKKAERKLKEQ